MVEGRYGRPEEGGAARDEEGQVGEARERGHERGVGVRGVYYVEGDSGVPEGLGYGVHGGFFFCCSISSRRRKRGESAMLRVKGGRRGETS